MGLRGVQPKPIAERFWPKVAVAGPDECWLWTASTQRAYGQLRHGDKMLKAHRVSYELAYGPVPDGLSVLHSCDNPPCVNPRHLRAGTQGDNAHDMYDRDRRERKAPSGEAHYAARLTWAEVDSIRIRHAAGESQSAISRDLGMHVSTINLIVNHKIWRRA